MEDQNQESVSIEVLKKGDPELIPFRDPEALAKFMDQPLPTIAAAITGALSSGYSDAILIGGRLIQAVLKGKLHQQVAREIRELIEKGKIKEDYANSKYGFKSLVELLEFIDSEVPDEDRLRAVKAMFFAVNAADTKEGEELINYQLFQISKKLSGGQLLVLKATYDLHKEGAFSTGSISDATGWFRSIASKVGHNLTALIQKEELVLISNSLITDRLYSDRSGVNTTNARLTDLGVRLCEVLVQYGDARTDVSENQ